MRKPTIKTPWIEWQKETFDEQLFNDQDEWVKDDQVINRLEDSEEENDYL